MHVSHIAEELDALKIIPDRTYRHLFLVNLLTFALKEFQNRVNKCKNGSALNWSAKCSGFFFLCTLES
jgi:hypothetical protein